MASKPSEQWFRHSIEYFSIGEDDIWFGLKIQMESSTLMRSKICHEATNMYATQNAQIRRAKSALALVDKELLTHLNVVSTHSVVW